MSYRTSNAVWKYIESHPYCAVSGKPVPMGVGVHHWRTVGSGGSDEDDNLDRLLPNYHREAHKIGIKEMAIKYKLCKPRGILIMLCKWTQANESRYNKTLSTGGVSDIKSKEKAYDDKD